MADNLPPSCAIVMKSGNINFLEPSGPFWACNRTALSSFTGKEKMFHFLTNFLQGTLFFTLLLIYIFFLFLDGKYYFVVC